MGPPNCSKTTSIKHIVLRAKPAFEEVIVIHCDPEYTQEWDDIDAEVICGIPDPKSWPGLVKTFVILDDIGYQGLSKEDKASLDRLFGYVSTHKNISVALTSQDGINIPPAIRRCSDIWAIWKTSDKGAMTRIAGKAGVEKEDFKNIFTHLMPNLRDGLWIDNTCDSPYPLRKNGFIMLTKHEDEEGEAASIAPCLYDEN